MTRKDYVLIAAVFADARDLDAGEAYPPLDAETLVVLGRRMAAALALDNEAFKMGKFLKAAGDPSYV